MLGPGDAQRSLDELFEDSNDAVFITDPGEDRILDANAAASRLLGYTREEFMVTPISRFTRTSFRACGRSSRSLCATG